MKALTIILLVLLAALLLAEIYTLKSEPATDRLDWQPHPLATRTPTPSPTPGWWQTMPSPPAWEEATPTPTEQTTEK